MCQHGILQEGTKTLKYPPHSHFLNCKYYFYAAKGLLLVLAEKLPLFDASILPTAASLGCQDVSEFDVVVGLKAAHAIVTVCTPT